MDKRFWLAVLAVFVFLGLVDPIVHGIFLAGDWQAKEVAAITRPEYKFLVFYICYFFIAFGLTYVYKKGHEGLGISEGIRFGFFISLISFLPQTYFTYAIFPIHYALALKWYLAGMVELMLIGIVLNKLFSKKAE